VRPAAASAAPADSAAVSANSDKPGPREETEKKEYAKKGKKGIKFSFLFSHQNRLSFT